MDSFARKRNTKLHAICDSQGRPLNLFVTAGQVNDYIGALALCDSLLDVDWLLGDRGYDADWFRKTLKDKGIRARCNRHLLAMSPDPKFAVTGDVEGYASTTFTVTPKLICQRVSAQTTEDDCGGGAGIKLSSRSADNLGRFDAGVAVEQVGDNMQTSLQLSLERRF